MEKNPVVVLLDQREIESLKNRMLQEVRQVIAEELANRETNATWLTEEQARKYLNVGRTTLYKLRRDGKIPFSQRKRKILYRRADLEKFLLETISTKT